MTLKVCPYMEGVKTVAVNGDVVHCSQEFYDRYHAGESLTTRAVDISSWGRLDEPMPITPISWPAIRSTGAY